MSDILYFCALENATNNNIHKNQIKPLLDKNELLKCLFITPIFEISRNRIGMIKLEKSTERVKYHPSPFPSFLFFCPIIFFPLVYIYCCIVLLLHVYNRNYSFIHCRNTLSASIAIPISKIFRLQVLCDVRGLYPDEGVIIGRWRFGSLSYNFFGLLEKITFMYSDHVSAVSPELCNYIRRKVPSAEPLYIPAIVHKQQFYFSPQLRNETREILGVDRSSYCLIYVGTIGAWHTKKNIIAAILDFMNQNNVKKESLSIIILSKNTAGLVEDLTKLAGKVICEIVAPTEVNKFLNAADFGLLPGLQITNKAEENVLRTMISSKAEEYLVCGLGVLTHPAIKFFEAIDKRYLEQEGRKSRSSYYSKEFSIEAVLKKYEILYGS